MKRFFIFFFSLVLISFCFLSVCMLSVNFGIADREGKIIVPVRYNDVFEWGGVYIGHRIFGKYDIYDSKGNFLYSLKKPCIKFNSLYYDIFSKKLYDQNHKLIFDNEFLYLYNDISEEKGGIYLDFSDNTCPFLFVDSGDKKIIDTKTCKIYKNYNTNRYWTVRKDNFYELYNIKGELLCRSKLNVQGIYKDFIIVKENEKLYIYDKNEKKVNTGGFDSFLIYDRLYINRAEVYDTEKNTFSKTDFSFDEVRDIYCRTEKNGKYGLIGENIYINPVYDNVFYNDNYNKKWDYFCVEKNKKMGLTDRKGNIKLPIKYTTVFNTEKYILANVNGRCELYDKKINLIKVFPKEFTMAKGFFLMNGQDVCNLKTGKITQYAYVQNSDRYVIMSDDHKTDLYTIDGTFIKSLSERYTDIEGNILISPISVGPVYDICDGKEYISMTEYIKKKNSSDIEPISPWGSREKYYIIENRSLKNIFRR